MAIHVGVGTPFPTPAQLKRARNVRGRPGTEANIVVHNYVDKSLLL